MAELCFHVVAEDPQEEQVAQDVGPATMEKHAGNEGKQGRFERAVSHEPGRDAGRNHSIGDFQSARSVRRQRKFVNEDSDIGQQQTNVDCRKLVGRILVAKRQEHGV
jgi:hypothetical protein